MRTTVIPTIKNLMFYGPFIYGGAVLSNQISKIPGVQENLDKLEQIVESTIGTFPENTAECLTAAVLAIATASTIKKSRKKRDFMLQGKREEEEKSEEEVIGEKNPLWKRVLGYSGKLAVKSTVATAAGAVLLRSYEWIPKVYDVLNSFGLEKLEQVNETLANIVDTTTAKVALGVGLVAGASKLYARGISRKHGPIVKRYYVDGWMRPTRFIHPKSLKIRRSKFLAGIESDETRGMHSSLTPCATIRVRDYRTGKKHKVIMGYRSDLEPHNTKRDLVAEDMGLIFDYLTEFIRGQEGQEATGVSPENIVKLADESGIYRAADDGYFRKKGRNLNAFDIGRLVKGVIGWSRDNKEAEEIDKPDLVRRLNSEALWDVGGYFQAGVYEGKTLSLRVTMRENIKQSDAISRDSTSGYGPDYAEKGKMLMVLQFRSYARGAHDIQDEEDSGEDVSDSSVGVTNVIREDKKAWNQLIKHGLGKSYVMYVGNRAFVYDEWWTGSGKFITDLTPGLSGREFAPRRIGYVYEGNRIVAKITDDPRTAITKSLGNCDRIVDVYDQGLGQNDNFGYILSIFSRFLTHQRKYRSNRIQEILPIGSPVGGADEDAGLQV